MIKRAFQWRAGSLILAALACLLLAAAMIVMTPRPVTQIAIAVSYRSDLAKFQHVAPYAALAPEGLPTGWQLVSSRLTMTGGVVSWHLGFVAPSGRIASLDESNERPAEFVRRITNDGDLLAPVWSAGEWWARRLRPDKDQRSMYRSVPGAFTLIISGTSGWRELAELAGSVRPQR